MSIVACGFVTMQIKNVYFCALWIIMYVLCILFYTSTSIRWWLLSLFMHVI